MENLAFFSPQISDEQLQHPQGFPKEFGLPEDTTITFIGQKTATLILYHPRRRLDIDSAIDDSGPSSQQVASVAITQDFPFLFSAWAYAAARIQALPKGDVFQEPLFIVLCWQIRSGKIEPEIHCVCCPGAGMRITKATLDYERWLASQTPLVKADIQFKHQEMAAALFPFLRATFYRWIQVWTETCPECNGAPAILAVGDLHVENYGTWRDIEGRLIWGINDFDEAYPLPYVIDLVRLAASADVAIEADHLAEKPKRAHDAILTGYLDALKFGGRPFVLAEDHSWLRLIALSNLRNPVHFWQKMRQLPRLRDRIPPDARTDLEVLLPEPRLRYKLYRRRSGLGSLGRQRYVALADFRGGLVAREAKALVASACLWANNGKGSSQIRYQAVIEGAVRCRDPFVQPKGHWIVRRLAPDCCRIELPSLPEEADQSRLLYSMGWETANVHLANPEQTKSILKDINGRPSGWLDDAAKQMLKVTRSDWREWKDAFGIGG